MAKLMLTAFTFFTCMPGMICRTLALALALAGLLLCSTYGASFIKIISMKEVDKIKANYASTSKPVGLEQQAPQAGVAQQCFDNRVWLDKFVKEPSWKKYSQGDQDAVLASLFSAEHLGTTNKDFVEFGFPDTDFTTSYGNGRHLKEALGFNNFLLLDGGHSNPAINLYKEFLSKDNIVDVFDKHHVPLEADYVSVDIDSCDLWLFRAITTKYRPRVMTVEYNSNYPLGDHSTLRCATSDKYQWHGDNIYGTSLSAIGLVAQQHGYTVAYVSPKLDAFLVRNDLLCQGSAVPLAHFNASTGLPFHAVYHDEQGPRSELVIDFKEWLAKHA